MTALDDKEEDAVATGEASFRCLNGAKPHQLVANAIADPWLTPGNPDIGIPPTTTGFETMTAFRAMELHVTTASD